VSGVEGVCGVEGECEGMCEGVCGVGEESG
jgi:hypothetical protein